MPAVTDWLVLPLLAVCAQEKQRIKEEKDEVEKKYKIALIDGREEMVRARREDSSSSSSSVVIEKVPGLGRRVWANSMFLVSSLPPFPLLSESLHPTLTPSIPP
jgi:hypothetical protein